jgi:hypothetical protein
MGYRDGSSLYHGRRWDDDCLRGGYEDACSCWGAAVLLSTDAARHGQLLVCDRLRGSIAGSSVFGLGRASKSSRLSAPGQIPCRWCGKTPRASALVLLHKGLDLSASLLEALVLVLHRRGRSSIRCLRGPTFRTRYACGGGRFALLWRRATSLY